MLIVRYQPLETTDATRHFSRSLGALSPTRKSAIMIISGLALWNNVYSLIKASYSTTWQAVYLFPQILETDFRRDRQKSFLLVGVAPQTL